MRSFASRVSLLLLPPLDDNELGLLMAKYEDSASNLRDLLGALGLLGPLAGRALVSSPEAS